MISCSKFWGNLEGIWGNPGEIPQLGWKIPEVYRVKQDNSNSLDTGVRYSVLVINYLVVRHINVYIVKERDEVVKM